VLPWRKLGSRGTDGGGWEERISPAWAPNDDELGWMKATGGSADKRSLVGFFGPERDSGGRGSSQRCRLGQRGSDSGRRWRASRQRGGVSVWELMGT
jgi:hypothetical protein